MMDPEPLRHLFTNDNLLLFPIERVMIITSLFRKLAKVLTNIFKIDINAISDPLETCKEFYSMFIGSALHRSHCPASAEW